MCRDFTKTFPRVAARASLATVIAKRSYGTRPAFDDEGLTPVAPKAIVPSGVWSATIIVMYVGHDAGHRSIYAFAVPNV
jgi:hypothetical protein